MKTIRFALVLMSFSALLASCSLFNKNKSGCPSDGRNVGAEKLLDGGPKKPPKYRG